MNLRLKVMLVGWMMPLLSAHVVAHAARIVDAGHDWGVGFYRDVPPQSFGVADVDGDGSTSDDQVRGWAFSVEDPLNPMENTYDWQLPSARFYGGIYVGVANRSSTKVSAPSEGHINQNHELRDDWNLMAMPSTSLQPELEEYEAAGVWLWQKEDFLNGGNDHTVSFSTPNDYIAVFVSRYWGGIDWGRWVIRDGADYYVSEPTFDDRTVRIDQSDADTQWYDAGSNPVRKTSHIVYPTAVRWTPYDPTVGPPQSMFFAWLDNPDYQYRNFNDVTAVGFMVQRDLSTGAAASAALTLKEPIALKWNAVQVSATVNRPDDGSWYVEMVPVGGTQAEPSLWAAKTELTYVDWLRVVRWAVTNQRARNFSDGSDREVTGYHFERDGAMGSAEVSLAETHSPLEPVTTVTWYDAVTWCNALSELEGLEPAYYADAAYTDPFRKILKRNVAEELEDRYPVYWKMDADGFRLPTMDEWRALAGNASSDAAVAWTSQNAGAKTQPTGGKPANNLGLHDMIGNVAEYVWDASGATFDPSTQTTHTVLGGSFRYPADENAATLAPFGEVPSRGSSTIGFRPVRNGPASGLPTPTGTVPERVVTEGTVVATSLNPMTEAQLRAVVAEWIPVVRIDGGGTLASGSTNTSVQTTDSYAIDVVKFEVSYRVWSLVKQWAEQTHGYRFNYSGDIGSARHNIELDRGPDEPVTHISWFDAVVWCNALSELMGLDPVYRSSSDEVEREASAFRLTMYDTYGYPNVGPHYPYDQQGREERDTTMDYELLPDPQRNGFRLPTKAEAYNYGDTAREVNDPRNRTTLEHGWFLQNANGKAQPVGTRLPNVNGIHDILGNVQEWTYGGSNLFGQYHYGNDFGWSNVSYPHTMNREDHVSAARAYLGFRVVRRSNVAARPQLTPENAQFEHELRIQVGSSMDDVIYRYTIDGSEPGPSHGMIVDGDIVLTESATVKVVALHDTLEPSEVTEATYEKLTGLPLGSPYPVVARGVMGGFELSWQNHATAHTEFVVERRLVLDPSQVEPDVEVILDNSRQNEVGSGDVVTSGYWTLNELEGIYGSDYLRRDSSGPASATFTPDLAGIEGEFEVFVWHPLNQWTIFVTNQPVMIHHADGVDTVTISGREGGGAWKSVGTYTMEQGSYVEFNNDFSFTTGQSFVDAVRFFRAGTVPEWEEVARVSADTRHYMDDSLIPGLDYEYRVTASDGTTSGSSTSSDVGTVPYRVQIHSEADVLKAVFPVHAASTDRRVRLLSSTDLSDWSTVEFDSLTDLPVNSDEVEWIEVPLTAEPGTFLRLEITSSEE